MAKTYSFPQSMRSDGDASPTVQITDFAMGVDWAKHVDQTKAQIIRAGRLPGKTTAMLMEQHCVPKRQDSWIHNTPGWKDMIDTLNREHNAKIAKLQMDAEHCKQQIAVMQGVIEDLEKKLKKEKKKVKKLVEESIKKDEAEKIAKAQREAKIERHDRNILV